MGNWWTGENSLWGSISGKKKRSEAKRAQENALSALNEGYTQAQSALSGVGEYTPSQASFENYKLPEAVQKRMNIIRSQAGQTIADQVNESTAAMARRGLGSSGVGAALAAKIRREGGQALNQNLSDTEMNELSTQRNFYLQDTARQAEENYRKYMANYNKAQALANIYMNKGSSTAQIAGQALPQEKSFLEWGLETATGLLGTGGKKKLNQAVWGE